MIVHLIGATVAAGAALLLSHLVRSATVRFAILLVGILQFVLPIPWVLDSGAWIASFWPASTIANGDFGPLRHPSMAIPVVIPAASTSHAAVWIGAIWAIVCAALLLRWIFQLAAPIAEVRAANASESESFARAAAMTGSRATVALRIVSPNHPPAASGLFKPAILLPEDLASGMTAAELDGVLAHELSHIRRRDNLSAAAVCIVRSAFWFHPLTWWIEQRMLTERERACDELVLSCGAQREAYLSALAKVCCRPILAASPYAAASCRSFDQRMKEILSISGAAQPSRWLRGLPAMLAAAIFLIPLTAGFLRAQPPAPRPNTANDALFRSAMDLFNQSKLEEAEAAFRALDAQEPDQDRAMIGLAEVYMKEFRGAEAVQLLQSAAEARPGRMGLRNALGNICIRLGSLDQAIAEFHKVIDSGQSDAAMTAHAWLGIGEAHRRKGEFNAAIDDFAKAGNEGALQHALLLEGSGRLQEARRAYEEVLKIQPDQTVALNNLAYLKAEAGDDLPGALKLAQHARDLSPRSADVIDTLGSIYLKMNRAESAADAFREALGVRDDPAFHFHLGLALLQKGDRPAARAELESARKGKLSAADLAKIDALLRDLR